MTLEHAPPGPERVRASARPHELARLQPLRRLPAKCALRTAQCVCVRPSVFIAEPRQQSQPSHTRWRAPSALCSRTAGLGDERRCGDDHHAHRKLPLPTDQATAQSREGGHAAACAGGRARRRRRSCRVVGPRRTAPKRGHLWTRQRWLLAGSPRVFIHTCRGYEAT